jgi:hypothetical protein
LEAPPFLVFASTCKRGRKLILIASISLQNGQQRAPYDLGIKPEASQARPQASPTTRRADRWVKRPRTDAWRGHNVAATTVGAMEKSDSNPKKARAGAATTAAIESADNCAF